MKILALDIGTAQIKLAIIEAKFKRFDVVLHDIIPVADAWEPHNPSEQMLSPGQLEALADIKLRYGQGIDRVVTNLPYSLYSSRFLTFPLKDKRKVESAVKFAIEDEIPFAVEDCIVTSHLFPTKIKETHVLTGFAQTKRLEAFIESLAPIHFSIDNLMMEDSALSAQFLRSKMERLKNVAVLNIGHRKTGMFFFQDGLPVLHRTTMTGGFNITAGIAAKYSLSIADAEAAKVERAFFAVPGMQLNSDQEVFTDTIRSALEPAFTAFQQSLMAFSSRYNEPLDMVYICGGTALIPGLPEYLAQRWQKKVSLLQVSRLYPQLSIQAGKNELLMPIATALGISQVSGEHKSQINFRSGKLMVAGRTLHLNFKQFVYPAKLATTIYLVGMFSLVGQLFYLNKQVEEKDAALTRAIQNVIGKVSASLLTQLKASPTKLKQSLAKEMEKFQSPGDLPITANSSLELIHDVSKAVPKSTVMEIDQWEFQQNQVVLHVSSPTQADAEKTIGLLTKIPRFVSPKASPIETVKGRKKFTLSANLPVKKGP